ncbi:MAG: protein phosphatase [Lachnospiraceae bacterium]|nr:protein phosphatase [Lachnospiraceae bacterium]
MSPEEIDEMNTSELLKQTAEENQTRKILEILNECQDLEEAKEKVRALLDK